MSNLLLVFLLTVLVLVNVYFTYRRETGLDSAGRKKIAAMQLVYLGFIAAVFVLGYLLKVTGLTKGAQAASAQSWIPFIVMTVVIIALFVVVMIFKARIEQNIRREHTIK